MADVEYARRGPVAYITLNRPEVLNALTDDMVRRLRDVLYEFDDDAEAQVAILHGDGRAFCSGADVRQRQLRPRDELIRLGGAHGRGASVTDIMYDFSNWKPIVAAVHGYVMGAGLYLALACEMIVAAEGTKFQITETSRGIDATPFWSMVRHRTTGAFATEVALTGRFWTADECLPFGGVDRLAKAGEQVQVAEALVHDELLLNPPLAVRAVVERRRGVLQEIEAQSRQSSRPRKLWLTEDFAESARAFVEKRKPVFKGR
jgi:enoyl-CoA hydratase/carnithine racemase